MRRTSSLSSALCTKRPSRAAPALLAALFFAAACGSAPPRPTYGDIGSRGADRDQDGAADVDDACPDDAEDGLPPKANDGCPATDPDNDGILLADDRCPNAKEDGAPPNPSDGCPTDDEDHDGVANAKDACPLELEDNLPPNPGDGCPAPDRDKDGIADANDKCPDQPETHNEYRDDDGCPDQAPGEVAYDPTSSEIHVPEMRKIEFELGSADLTPAAQATLTEVAKVLKAHPDIQRVEIEGHASSKGDASYNVQLTERRARAVGQALANGGVEEKRLVPIGYGEYCPAVDRGDEVDDPVNRRVLLKAVQVRGVWQDIPRGCWRAKTLGIDPTKRKPGLSKPPAGPSNPQSPPYVPPSGGA
jgi:outer membrane protein OmpA-like peptidoglycan-associated protein